MLVRRFIDNVKQQSWFAVGLDVLVVIVGIFVGLQVTAWNNERANKATEIEYLLAIKKDLTADIEIIKSIERTNERKLAVFQQTITLLLANSSDAEIATAFAANFDRFGRFGFFRQSRTAYDNLTDVHSIELIKAKALRNHIAEYYYKNYQFTEGTQTQVARVSRSFAQTFLPKIMNGDTLALIFEQENNWPKNSVISVEDKKQLLSTVYLLQNYVLSQNETLNSFSLDAGEIASAIEKYISGGADMMPDTASETKT
ncbi:DUF6090 family protein [Alteromonas lipolytica]|uniref:Uncharacterized protein n=1 Tax=Alteromonas lipolytica TaxID=1856405 RepID=A0A1E8FK80_9ALTE|nr:DUF6090 family protein [Alteromonas lipolytica]OFI36325.1 hypothetical protein BFC17_00140 [Alteromonas lipolytica]GGF70814.1 hypothetical protein GCM10011338_23730 [Alteromonas lipolytica]